MQHPKWFLNTVEPRLWAIIGLDYGMRSTNDIQSMAWLSQSLPACMMKSR